MCFKKPNHFLKFPLNALRCFIIMTSLFIYLLNYVITFNKLFQMLNGLFWRLNSGIEVNRILRMRQRRVAVSFNSPKPSTIAETKEENQQQSQIQKLTNY
jgi:hypothetical protein